MQLFLNLPRGTEENHNKSVRIAILPVKNRTQALVSIRIHNHDCETSCVRCRLYFQASHAESHVFHCLQELDIPGLWLVFFQGRSYGGKSFRKERNGKLVMREHDYVFFTSYNGQCFHLLNIQYLFR